ncbi:hypothetical protein SHIRM173S_06539 [Streptomyces hirsutus]
MQHGRRGHQLGDRHQLLLDQQRQEVVPGAGRSGPAMGALGSTTRAGCSSPAIRISPLVTPSTACSGAAFSGGGGSGLGQAGLVGVDGAHRALELLLGDLDDLRGQAARVGEGEHGGLVPDEQDGAGALLPQLPWVRQDVQS